MYYLVFYIGYLTVRTSHMSFKKDISLLLTWAIAYNKEETGKAAEEGNDSSDRKRKWKEPRQR
jgi:hypothetical protein